jgi:hypothetical protein
MHAAVKRVDQRSLLCRWIHLVSSSQSSGVWVWAKGLSFMRYSWYVDVQLWIECIDCCGESSEAQLGFLVPSAVEHQQHEAEVEADVGLSGYGFVKFVEHCLSPWLKWGDLRRPVVD